MKDALKLDVMGGDNYADDFDAVLVKMANISEMTMVTENTEGAVSFMARTNEYFVPMDGMIDVEAELEKLRKELAHQEGFLKGVMKKLGNERFVGSAPEAVVAKERSETS